MKYLKHRSVHGLGLSMLFCLWAAARTMGGGCAVSDGSELPSAKGCVLAFVYNQADDHRLVVIDETNRRRYEAPLREAGEPPFWDGGKVYVVHPSGSVQGFLIESNGLVAEKQDTISNGAVFTAEFKRSQHRLYLIRTDWEAHHKTFVHNLVAIDFPTRKTLWTKGIDEPGLLKVFEPYVCVMGQKLVQVFDCDTGNKIAGIEAAKAAVSADANTHK